MTSKSVHYTIKCGKNAGVLLRPHRHLDGKYVVSPSRFSRDYLRFNSIDEAVAVATAKGFGIRMSDPGNPKLAPSLIRSFA